MGPLDPAYYGMPEKVVSVALKQASKHRIIVLVSTEKFLYKMCRRIVGALVEVGRGCMAPEDISSVSRDRVPTAPPFGLCLDRAKFPACFPEPPRPQGEEDDTHNMEDPTFGACPPV
eukprot:TRINITY_DN19194_c1_g2_i1.p1 TRINITY_DN19194_c1_g2~~TRINITY_DN19194_c1_g2_i1.p1  ORF type:complete len:125 (+),score=20.21 TRINITY_DN19194_c1_g2_i1:25-375(+)